MAPVLHPFLPEPVFGGVSFARLLIAQTERLTDVRVPALADLPAQRLHIGILPAARIRLLRADGGGGREDGERKEDHPETRHHPSNECSSSRSWPALKSSRPASFEDTGPSSWATGRDGWSEPS